MKTGLFSLAAAALLSSTAGAVHGRRHGHAMFHQKRDVVVQTAVEVVTDIVYIDNDATSTAVVGPPAPAPTTLATSGIPVAAVAPEPASSPATSASPVASTSSAAPAVPATSESPPSSVVPSTPAAPPTSTSSAPAAPPSVASSSSAPSTPKGDVASNSGSGSSVGKMNTLNQALSSNGALGITYVPFQGTSTTSTTCKSSSQINSEMSAIHKAGFNTARIYSPSDCNQLSEVHQATQSNGMSLIIGIYLSSAGSAQSDFSNQMKAITDYFATTNGFPGVSLITVGNEAIFNNYVDAGTLASMLDQARGTLRGAGYQGPITTVDIVSSWQSNPSICSHVDVYASNIHPFYSDTAVDPSDAGDYTDQQIQNMQQACSGQSKPVVVTESGWPTQGNELNGMTPSVQNQQAFIKSMLNSKYANGVTFFANQDDLWKSAPGVQTYETHFGCLPAFQSQ